MGYYTNYKLSKPSSLALDQENKLMEVSPSYFSSPEDVQNLLEGWMEAKWYDHEEEMRELSKAFPKVLFQLEGNGEESGDQWIKYFKGGKQQTAYAIITFDEFDETKLK
jgi:hypothetical protein